MKNNVFFILTIVVFSALLIACNNLNGNQDNYTKDFENFEEDHSYEPSPSDDNTQK